ncbi:MAG TPA: XdhC family protein [Gammaproteobacteria bacterium]|nr:XdhC family protein [Gammaproteobacteria bacterium]
MSVRQILEYFDTWRARGEPLVLATVYDTLGSTYSKAGHRILIAGNGDYRGLVSGGCLEGDLAERSRAVLASDAAAAVTYDLRDEVDEVWGLGVGCNGLLRVFLQPLRRERDYQPFAAIAGCLAGGERAGIATVVESSNAQISAGATVISRAASHEAWGFAPRDAERLAERTRSVLAAGSARVVVEEGASILCAPLRPIPKLLVLGAGLDAVPLVAMAAELGWFVTVADHRPAYLARGGFPRADRALLVDPAALASSVMVDDFDAIVVMSHHLATDRKYLAQLAATRARYLGVLGPRARRERLVAELDDVAPQLRARLRGPVGIDIGADSPESIALSILAELQVTLAASKR